MARAFEPVVISANDLFDGRVIYLTGKDEWVSHLRQAELITDEEQARHRMAEPVRQEPPAAAGMEEGSPAMLQAGPAPATLG